MLDEQLDPSVSDGRSAKTIKTVVSILMAASWAFVLYVQVALSMNRFFPGPDIPNPGPVRIVLGVFVIAVTVVVAAATAWFTRRLPAGFIAAIHILVMFVLVFITWV